MKGQMFNFLKRLMIIAFPIVLQQLFLNFASLLDTLMVGQLDEISISGVYVATQIIFVGNIMIFGSIEGATVFFSQFYGSKDKKHMRNCYAMKFVFAIGLAVIETLILAIFGRDLASLFLSSEAEIDVAVKYLNIVLISTIPFAISVTVSSTLREVHKSLPPMIITFFGIILNLTFNYLFIYGIGPFPELGASGAAIGTLINRVVETIFLVGFVAFTKQPFNKNFFKSFKVEKELFVNVVKKSIPLFLNETVWSLSQIILVYFFSQSDAIATTVLPIVQTIFNLIFVVLLGLGNGISILVANSIGDSKFDKAQKEAIYSVLFSVVCCLILGTVLLTCSDLIVSLYKGVGLQARELASFFIKFSAIYLLINGVNTTLFFLLRAGGKTEIVFMFDSCFCLFISIPFTFLLVTFTDIPFKTLYILVYLIEILKSLVGVILLFSKKWYKNLVVDTPKEIAHSVN